MRREHQANSQGKASLDSPYLAEYFRSLDMWEGESARVCVRIPPPFVLMVTTSGPPPSPPPSVRARVVVGKRPIKAALPRTWEVARTPSPARFTVATDGQTPRVRRESEKKESAISIAELERRRT